MVVPEFQSTGAGQIRKRKKDDNLGRVLMFSLHSCLVIVSSQYNLNVITLNNCTTCKLFMASCKLFEFVQQIIVSTLLLYFPINITSVVVFGKKYIERRICYM